MQKSNWKKCRLSDIADVRDGTHDSPKEVTGYGFPLVTSRHICNGKIDLSNTYNISEKDYNDINLRSKVNLGDILISMIGTVGQIAYVNNTPQYAIKNIGLIKPNDLESSKYIFYYLQSPIAQEDILSRLKGTTQQYLSLGELRNFPITLPPLDEQKRIAEILGAFDDKIELLQKQNKTLEEMAKAIFKSWFVDFDIVKAKQKGEKKEDIIKNYHLTEELYNLFPSSFVDSALGPIPLGWKVKIIEDLGEVICGKTPSTIHKEYYGGNIPFITIPDMHNNIFAGKTERYLTEEGAQSQSNKTLPPYSVCVSCIATPGLVVMTAVNSQTNQQINSVIPRNLGVRYYNYYILRSVAKQIRVQGSGGSVFGNLNKTSFSKIKILWAVEDLQKAFTKENIFYFDKILNNNKQIQTLTELRDTLLPRLISGKIKV